MARQQLARGSQPGLKRTWSMLTRTCDIPQLQRNACAVLINAAKVKVHTHCRLVLATEAVGHISDAQWCGKVNTRAAKHKLAARTTRTQPATVARERCSDTYRLISDVFPVAGSPRTSTFSTRSIGVPAPAPPAPPEDIFDCAQGHTATATHKQHACVRRLGEGGGTCGNGQVGCGASHGHGPPQFPNRGVTSRRHGACHTLLQPAEKPQCCSTANIWL